MKMNALFPIAVLLMLIGVKTATGVKSLPVERFRVTRQIAGWSEEKKSFMPINATTLFEIIDGGAPEYIDNGMQKGFFQRLKRTDSAVIELFAEDFGSNENARKILSVKQAHSSGLLPASGTTDSTAFFYNQIIGGYWVCGIAGSNYFEFTLMGMSDKAEAIRVIDRFIEYFRKTALSRKVK